MTLPRYPKYKDSGVEWLGEVPEHWLVDRLKQSIESCKNGIWGEEPQEDENDIPCVRVADFDRERLRVGLTNPTIRNVTQKERLGRVLRKGDLLIEKSGGGETQPVGCVVRYADDRPAVCSNFVARMQTREGMDSSFWRYVHAAAYAIRLTVGSINQTSGIQNLDAGRYFDERVAFPPPHEQSAIAGFLEGETIKIDSLVDEQRRLIELLKEKRQAVISHAVTKGLNPGVQFKDSGNQWVGLIPSTWNMSKVKYEVSEVVDCLHTTPTYDGELVYPAIRTADLEPGRILLAQARLVSKDVYLDRVQRLEPEAGDILYSREGERFGIAALVPTNIKLCLGQRMMMFRPKRENDSSYLMWALNSSAVYQQVLEGVTGPTAPHVNIADVINVCIPIPDRAEQQLIGNHIDLVAEQMDGLILSAQTAIDLLQERRTALISAAVTGKIDVRGMAKEQTA